MRLEITPQEEGADLARLKAPLVEMEEDDKGDAEESRQAKGGGEHKGRVRTERGKIAKF